MARRLGAGEASLAFLARAPAAVAVRLSKRIIEGARTKKWLVQHPFLPAQLVLVLGADDGVAEVAAGSALDVSKFIILFIYFIYLFLISYLFIKP